MKRMSWLHSLTFHVLTAVVMMLYVFTVMVILIAFHVRRLTEIMKRKM